MLGRILEAYRAAFRGLPREVWTLATLGLINRSGTMVLAFLALYLTTQHGYTIAEAGALIAVYGVGGMLGTLAGGRLTDRVGPRAVMGGSLICTGLWFLAFTQFESRLALTVGAAVLGVLSESFRPANGVALTAASTPETRPRAFGLYRLAINIGVTIGPVVGGALATRSYSWLFIVDGSTCLAAAAFLFAKVPNRPVPRIGSPTDAPAPVASPWRDRRYVAALFLMSLQALIFFQVLSTFPVFLREAGGHSELAIGSLFAVNTVLIVLFEMVLVHRIARRDPLRVAAVAGLLTGVGFSLVVLDQSFVFVGFSVAVWTVGEMLGIPVMHAWTANRAPAAARGRYLSAFDFCFNLTSVVAPLAGSWVYEHAGTDALWYGCLGLGIVQWIGFRMLAARAAPGG